MRSFSRFALALAAALAVLPLASSGAAAQGREAQMISRAELAASNASNLYEAVAALRPEWLLLVGDTADAGQAQRLLVFMNGRHVGDVRALRWMSVHQVRSAQLHGQEYVRLNYPRFPRTPFTAAIFVTRLGPEPAPPPGRVTVTLDAGLSPVSFARRVSGALDAQGYDRPHRDDDVTGARDEFYAPGTAFPPSVGAGLHVALRGGWGVGVSALHTLEGWAGGYSLRVDEAASATFTSTEGALLVSRQLGSGTRIGLGPALRVVDWTWMPGFCQCRDQTQLSTSAVGGAAEAALRLPVRPWRVFPQVRMQARYYPSQDASNPHVQGSPDAGGLVVTVSAGVATRF